MMDGMAKCMCMNLRISVMCFLIFNIIYLIFIVGLVMSVYFDPLVRFTPVADYVCDWVCWTCWAISGLAALSGIFALSMGSSRSASVFFLIHGVFNILALLGWVIWGSYWTMTLYKKTKQPLIVGNGAGAAQASIGRMMAGGAATMAAALFWPQLVQFMMQILPYPIDYLFYFGVWPYLPLVFLVLIPFIMYLVAVAPSFALAAVISKGGLGNEQIAADHIQRFLALPAGKREAFLDGNIEEEELWGDVETADGEDEEEEEE